MTYYIGAGVRLIVRHYFSISGQLFIQHSPDQAETWHICLSSIFQYVEQHISFQGGVSRVTANK